MYRHVKGAPGGRRVAVWRLTDGGWAVTAAGWRLAPQQLTAAGCCPPALKRHDRRSFHGGPGQWLMSDDFGWAHNCGCWRRAEGLRLAVLQREYSQEHYGNCGADMDGGTRSSVAAQCAHGRCNRRAGVPSGTMSKESRTTDLKS